MKRTWVVTHHENDVYGVQHFGLDGHPLAARQVRIEFDGESVDVYGILSATPVGGASPAAASWEVPLSRGREYGLSWYDMVGDTDERHSVRFVVPNDGLASPLVVTHEHD